MTGDGRELYLAEDDARGRTLADALQEAGAGMKMECGGTGSCGTCSVRLRGVSILYHGAVLHVPADSPWMMRSCQIELESREAEIEIPASSLLRSE